MDIGRSCLCRERTTSARIVMRPFYYETLQRPTESAAPAVTCGQQPATYEAPLGACFDRNPSHAQAPTISPVVTRLHRSDWELA
jgi:hypothetical protein